jgi:hypothetical protein
MLAEKISGTRNFLLCRCPKTIANNRWRLTRGVTSGLCSKEEVRHAPAAASWQVQKPGDFFALHFPKPVSLEAFPLLVSFETLHVKRCRKTGF